MRKVVLMVLMVVMIVPINVFADDPPFEPDDTIPPGVIELDYRARYWPNRDEYRVDYVIPPSNTWVTFRAEYYTFWGVHYQIDYTYATGIMYLTCNGYYWLKFLDANDDVVAQTRMITTTLIDNPACQSYPEEQQGKSDFESWYDDDPGGGYNLGWDNVPDASGYDIYVDGEKIGSTDTPGFHIDEPGGVSIVAKDSQGNTIGTSDLQVPNLSGGSGGGSGCNTCDKIRDALDCPHWGEYMGSLTDAVKAAWPTNAEWQNIANIFSNSMINAFDDYLGDMPTAPSTNDIYNQINEPLPDIDTSWPDAENLVPEMPAEYDDPWDFDITSGEQIQVIDESQPITIDEPLHNIDYDDPGEMVFPNDPRNSTGGIKIPDSINLPMPEPSPGFDDPIPPGNDPPMPSDPGGPGPIPPSYPGVGPVPNW